jgi:hypothetical protein
MAGVVPAGTSKIRIKFLADNYTENYFGQCGAIEGTFFFFETAIEGTC